MSVYFGLSAGLQLLDVSSFSVMLESNKFTSCTVLNSVIGGNAYGGAVSLYIGGYSSVYMLNGIGVAAVGDTVVRNVNLTLDAAEFASCSTRRSSTISVHGASVYGGSFSFYIGAYAWSYGKRDPHINISSTCGATNVSNVDVRILNVISNDSSALQTSSVKETLSLIHI